MTAALALTLIALAQTPAASDAAPMIRPGEPWTDTAGKPINAHGGGMLFHDGTYYWYGENKEGRTWLPPPPRPGTAIAST